MTNKICDFHRKTPVPIYHECIGCELMRLQAEIKQLKMEVKELSDCDGYVFTPKQRAPATE